VGSVSTRDGGGAPDGGAAARPVLKSRALGPFSVSAIGLGCMNLSHAYGVPPAPEAAAAVLRRALELGVTHFDTAALYGFGSNEELVGRTLAPFRREFTLASKCGIQGVTTDAGVRRVIDGRPATLRRTCEEALRRLRTDVIDLYYLHRWDKSVPIEDSVGALAELKRQGKIRAIGLSEVSAATLRRAHAVHPIAAMQSEYSLVTRNPEIAVLEACRELGTSFVAFSPLGRGFLAGGVPDVAQLEAKDLRRSLPRFEPAHHARNLRLFQGFAALAREAGCTAGQLAVAWVLSRGEHILAIPGTTRLTNLEEDVRAGEITVDASLLARAGQLIGQGEISGERYNAVTQAEIDTEEFD
jgi:aryl-alcohol dehydrogenase-like predicted oxidoreductase